MCCYLVPRSISNSPAVLFSYYKSLTTKPHLGLPRRPCPPRRPRCDVGVRPSTSTQCQKLRADLSPIVIVSPVVIDVLIFSQDRSVWWWLLGPDEADARPHNRGTVQATRPSTARITRTDIHKDLTISAETATEVSQRSTRYSCSGPGVFKQ